MDIRVAAYGVIVRDGQVLLTHWHEGRQWSLPGGGIEAGEQPADAAVREIFEETGFVASLGRLLLSDSIVIPAEDRMHGTDDLHAIRIVYEASIVSGELTHELDGSSDEARWVDLDALHELPRVDLVTIALEAWRG